MKTDEKNKGEELSAIHDFGAKLRQPDIFPRLKAYVQWQSKLREAEKSGETLDELLENSPNDVPISINLDLTTSCNYACDHCVDMDILNTGIQYQHDKLKDSLRELTERGLKSVIVIGGGEPTVYPKFQDIIRFMKGLGLQLGIVTNGSFNNKIAEVADCFDQYDWVRLSLDSGTTDTFVKMHKPRRPITLEEIVAGIPPIKKINDSFPIGFSYIIVWEGAEANDATIVENIDEMAMAAKLANDHEFNYISFKPFLERAPENNAEFIGLKNEEYHYNQIMKRIEEQLEEAKKLNSDNFRILESTNLKVLKNRSFKNYTHQPKTCHMTFFRQVLSPLGLYNCPVYRNIPHARISEKHTYADALGTGTAQKNAIKNILEFNATEECQEVACLYNPANWWLEDLIENPYKIDELEPSEDRKDFFL